MSIPSQLPLIALAARAGALQALALQAGQILDGKVIGPAPNGGTQVQINGQMLNLLLPGAAVAGAMLSFEVQGSGAQIRLALLPQPAPPPQAQVSAQPPVSVSVGAQAAIATAPQAQPQAGQSVAAALPTNPSGVAVPIVTNAPNGAASAAPIGAPSQPPITQPYAQSKGVAMQAPVQTATTTLSTQTQSAPVERAVSSAVTPAQPTTAKAALAQMVQVSVPRQDSVANLTSALSSIAGKVALPEPVMRAAQRVLAGQVSLEAGKLDGAAMQKAILGSGLFQEAQLAKGATTLVQGDMKGSLLALRQTLTTWLGNAAPLAQVAQVPPPLKGAVPRAKSTGVVPLDPSAAPDEIGRQVLERTEGALARIRLHQHASLPDAQAKGGGDWSLDVPVLVGQHQTMMQFQIHCDQHNGQETGGERGWQMRFAINLPELGEVGAQVSLRGQATGVMLWGADPAASAALEGEVETLRQALVGVGLKPGAIVVRHGEPPTPQAAPTGSFVDART